MQDISNNVLGFHPEYVKDFEYDIKPFVNEILSRHISEETEFSERIDELLSELEGKESCETISNEDLLKVVIFSLIMHHLYIQNAAHDKITNMINNPEIRTIGHIDMHHPLDDFNFSPDQKEYLVSELYKLTYNSILDNTFEPNEYDF